MPFATTTGAVGTVSGTPQDGATYTVPTGKILICKMFGSAGTVGCVINAKISGVTIFSMGSFSIPGTGGAVGNQSGPLVFPAGTVIDGSQPMGNDTVCYINGLIYPAP